MKFETKEKYIQVYRAGGYVVAHVHRKDVKKDSYRLYRVLGNTIGEMTPRVKDGWNIFNVADVANYDKVVKIPFGNIEIHGVELVKDEAEVRRVLAPFGTEGSLLEGRFTNMRTLVID